MHFGDDEPFPIICSVQMECLEHNDESRWLIALISDTGMRLSEAARLIENDLGLDNEYPYIALKT